MNDEQVLALTSAWDVQIAPSRGFFSAPDERDDAFMEMQRRALQAASPGNPFMENNRRVERPPQAVIDNGPTATLEEIHAAFDNAAEDAVKEAQKILNDARIQRAERLKALGFASAADVREHAPALGAIEIGALVAPLIVEYEEKYQKKFITEEQVEFLAKKYNLIFGPAKKFRGQVPEENLIEVERFMTKAPIKPVHTEMMMVAPYADFDTRGYTIRDNKMVYDPIVLYPVKGGYLIVTAWGEEAKDELVQRAK